LIYGGKRKRRTMGGDSWEPNLPKRKYLRGRRESPLKGVFCGEINKGIVGRRRLGEKKAFLHVLDPEERKEFPLDFSSLVKGTGKIFQAYEVYTARKGLFWSLGPPRVSGPQDAWNESRGSCEKEFQGGRLVRVWRKLT